MIIQSKRVFIDGKFKEAQLEIENGKISKIYEYGNKSVDVDYENNRILPGFYDVHTHGYHGFDTNMPEKEGLKNWLKDIVKEGVCGICPTTVTHSKETLLAALKNVAEVKKENPEGAEILGIHFEGPYLDKTFKGAQPEAYCVKPDLEEFIEYQKAADGLINIITMATEHDTDYKLTEYASKNGVNVSIGHSGATFKQALEAIKHGANSITHTYNGMSGFHHRDGGLVNAALAKDELWAEIICDGNHCTLDCLKIFFNCKKDKAIMITDSLMCKGYPVGSKFNFGGQNIEIYEDGSAHLMEGKKNLAGSTLKVNKGLKILVEDVKVPFNDALASCSSNPMRYLKMDDHKGYIKENYDADIVVLDDEYEVINTYCKGVKY